MFLLLVSLAMPLHAVLMPVVWIGGQGSPTGTVADPANWDGTLTMTGADDVLFDGTASSPTVYIPYLTLPDKIGLHDITFDSSSLTFDFHGNGTTSYLVLDGSLTATSLSNAVFNSDLAIQLTPGIHTADIGTDAKIAIASNISNDTTLSSIKKTGAGFLQLSGTNTFTGGVTLEAGWLLVGSNAALGTGALTLTGGTLAPIANVSLANNVALNSSIKLGDCDTTTSITFTGVISGTGAFDTHGSGDIVFSGNNTWTGGIAFYGANHVYVNHANALGTGAVHFESTSDTVLNIVSGINASIGSLSGGDYEYDAEIHLNSTASLTINQTADGVYGGAISGYNDGSTDGGLVKNGSATLTLAGQNSYSGPTIINAGTLVADGANNYYQLGHGAVTINSGATLALKDTNLLNSTVSVESGGKLVGYGRIGDSSIGSATTIKSGGVLSPGIAGSSPIGELTFDHLTLQSGAIYEWNLQNPSGWAGNDWDLVSISNYSDTLHIDSTTSSKLTLKLISLNGAGAAGTATGFVFQNYQWKIFDGGGVPIVYGSGGFDPALFDIDKTGFVTDFGTGTGHFSLTADTYSIYLNFTPVPEPSTYALMALGLAGTGLAAWRKRRRA
jgi:autotransporter-associated beta strand protein